MIKLSIKYSIKNEVERLKHTVNKLDWYKEKGYKLSLPENFSSEDPNFKDEEYIENSILSEYNEKDYKEKEDFILEYSEKIKTALEKFFNETKIKPQDIYEILLTRYGVGGSYGFPSLVTINIEFCKNRGLIKTIIHEIIHISIEDLIQKYNVGHWEKERVVDLIFDKIAPELNIIQKLPTETEKIDKIFEEKYPNIKEITKSLA